MPNLSNVINTLLNGDEDWKDFVDKAVKNSKFGDTAGKLISKSMLKQQNSTKMNQDKEAERVRQENMDRRRTDSNDIIMNSGKQKVDIGAARSASNNNDVFPLDITPDNAALGFIYSEVLGKPLCKRRRRNRW